MKKQGSQQTQNICITFIQRRPNVFDVGPTLYKYYTECFVFAGLSRYVVQNVLHKTNAINVQYPI